MVNAFKFEYLLHRKGIEYTAANPSEVKYDLKNDYLFQPNKTINLLAAETRRSIAMAEDTCPPTQIEPILSDRRLEEDKKFGNENAVGELLVGKTAVISMTKVGERRCNDVAQVARIISWLKGLAPAK